jgi:hypothetical protein
VERLTARDVSNLRVEDHGQPMHVAALLLLDGAALFAADGSFRYEAIAAEIERGTRAAPRLRQVLRRSPARRGDVALVEDAAFDVRRHVRVREVPAPGDEAALLALCASVNRPALDRSQPLWEIWFLTGLADGTVAMLIRLHHVIGDGIAAVALLGALFGGGAAPPPVSPASTAAAPSGRALGAGLGAVWRFLGDGLAPKTSLTGRIGDRRLLFLARGDLERARAVAHEHGGTVNDIMLTAVAAGARELLSARGELRPNLELRVSVPVSRRPAGEARVGNQVGVMIVPLPVGIADPAERLGWIARSTSARKRDPRAAMGWDVGSPLLQRAVVGLMRHQRFIHLLLSNVPGPTEPLRVAGAQVREAFQLGAIQGNVTIAVGALSYAGQLNLDVIADDDACADASTFADGLRRELDTLGVAR